MNSDFREHSQKSRPFPERRETEEVRAARENITLMFQESKRESGEHSQNSLNQQWCELSEVIESDFLISPGDVYPNRKVELEDADIKDSTRVSFEELCEQQNEAFSKNNKDIGRTQLIENEIDTGHSLPVVQSPYTLPLKHYHWVCQEIETLEKLGVIERSLSR